MMLCGSVFRFLERTSKYAYFIHCNSFHSTNVTYSRGYDYEGKKKLSWTLYNDKIFPPQSPEEPRRPGYVVHVKQDVKYSYKKMWYIACFIRGMRIDEALKQLQFLPKKGANIARETLLEAQKMAVEEHNIEFKSNLWVSESFVGKSFYLPGYRRCARGKMAKLKFKYIHYFVTLEEGSPPEYYYHFKRPKTGPELLEEWIKEMRNRKVIAAL